MSERYYITGVQIGIIKAFLSRIVENKEIKEIKQVIKEVEDKQFVGNITSKGDKVIIR